MALGCKRCLKKRRTVRSIAAARGSARVRVCLAVRTLSWRRRAAPPAGRAQSGVGRLRETADT
eukprot:7241621-Prymnesium_polylepis.1